MQGYDISKILEIPTQEVRDCILIENDEEVGPLESRLRHLVTKDHKLTIYEGTDDFGDIYDRKLDPYELNNLWNDRDFRDTRFKLVNMLLQENLKAQTKFPKRIAAT
jgi:hypothetical protein